MRLPGRRRRDLEGDRPVVREVLEAPGRPEGVRKPLPPLLAIGPARVNPVIAPEITDRLDRIERHLAALAENPRVAQLEPWLSKKEAAAAIGVSAKWLQERVNEGLPHRTIAQGHKFRLSVIEPWLKARGHLKESA